MEFKLSGTIDKELSKKRLDQIPIIYARGSHYEVGYIIGRQCKSMIEDLVNNWVFLQRILLPTYNTERGKEIYNYSLSLCKEKFGNYVNELEGISAGSGIPFFKLFLLHIDSLIASPDAEEECFATKSGTGCTSVLTNSDEVLIGHTEDTCPEFLNNVYIVAAEILDDSNHTVEKFTTLTYAGHLPGYTMGYNYHGLIYTVNTIYPKETFYKRTPRHFLARAILSGKNFTHVMNILRDLGTGISDGFSLNLSFASQEGSPVMHNIEIGPNQEGKLESELSVLTLTHGDYHVHCNKLAYHEEEELYGVDNPLTLYTRRYLRLQIPELPGIAWESSNQRHKSIGKHLRANTKQRLKEILSDGTDEEFPVFRVGGKPDYCKTVSVVLSGTNALSSGATYISCRTMYPVHGVGQIKSIPPYEVFVSSDRVYGNNGTVTVTIRGRTIRDWFKGFMMQAKPTGYWQKRSQKSLGYFRRTEGMKLLDCYGERGNAITQSHTQYNEDIVVDWVPPKHYIGRVTFVATIVRRFHEFWLNVHSKPVTII